MNFTKFDGTTQLVITDIVVKHKNKPYTEIKNEVKNQMNIDLSRKEIKHILSEANFQDYEKNLQTKNLYY